MKFNIGENNIVYLGSNFQKLFSKMPVKSSKNVLIYQKLPRNMNDKEILAELKPTEVSLGEVHQFLKEADRSLWYLFYVKDSKGFLWAVYAGWSSVRGGWLVNAYSVERPGGWDAGDRVVSRKSFGSKSKPSDPLELRVLKLEEQFEALHKFLVF